MNCIKVNSKQILDTNQIISKRCYAIDSESSHISYHIISNQFISHMEYSEPLSLESFKSFKEYNYSLSQSDIEYIPQSKEINSSLSSFLLSLISNLKSNKATQNKVIKVNFNKCGHFHISIIQLRKEILKSPKYSINLNHIMKNNRK